MKNPGLFFLCYLLIWAAGFFVGTKLEEIVEATGYPLPDWWGLQVGTLIVWVWVLTGIWRIAFKIADDD